MNTFVHPFANHTIFGKTLPRCCILLVGGGRRGLEKEMPDQIEHGNACCVICCEGRLAKEKAPLSKGACDAEKRRGIDNRLPFVYICW